MDDKELLELAAKAAGIECWYLANLQYFGPKHRPIVWNPLSNDGDALHLAVKLGLFIDPYGTSTDAAWHDCLLSVEHGECKYAATRRAITRAAAEIGKALP